jgi:hypothetical protein
MVKPSLGTRFEAAGHVAFPRLPAADRDANLLTGAVSQRCLSGAHFAPVRRSDALFGRDGPTELRRNQVAFPRLSDKTDC